MNENKKNIVTDVMEAGGMVSSHKENPVTEILEVGGMVSNHRSNNKTKTMDPVAISKFGIEIKVGDTVRHKGELFDSVGIVNNINTDVVRFTDQRGIDQQLYSETVEIVSSPTSDPHLNRQVWRMEEEI